MSILSWNYRGLGQPRTVQELVCLVHTYRPKIVFLSETRRCEEKVRRIRWRIGLRHCFTHDGKGKGGCIALYWDDQINIEVLSYGPQYFDVLVGDVPHGPSWRGTFAYGEPKSQDRHHMWTLLKRIRPNANEPWMMIGDFNETMWQSGHFSGTRRSEGQMARFRSVLSYCNLHDLGFRGQPWTYDNKQQGARNVRARIDRGVASPMLDGYV